MATDPRFAIEDEPPQRSRGCFFYGCITMVVLALVGAVVIFVAVRAGMNFLRGQIEQYTAAAPAQLPPLNVSADDRKKLVDRVEEFRKLVEGDGTLTDEQRTLELTADELNVLIEEEENDLKGHARVEIAGDKLQGEISIPLGNIPMMGGRYLNGRATIIPRATDGRLQIRLADIEVKGQRLPKEVQDELGKENFMPDNRPEGDRNPPLRPLESVTVADGKVRIVVAAERSSTEPAGPPGEK